MRQIEQKPDVIGRRGTARNYDEDLQKIRKLDLSLLKWSESLPAIETGMNLPVALAVLDDGNICIGGDKAVAILSPDGKEVKRVEMKLSPQALAVADKTIYVAGRKSVAVLTADGTQQAQWKPLGDKAHLVSLAASDEYVYAADAGNRVVMRYDRKTGKRTYKNGRLDSGAFLSGFNVPSPHLDVAVTPDGHLLTVDPGRFLVQVRDAYGNVLKSWGSAGAEITRFYGCCNPAAIAPLGKEGIVTYKKTLQRVKVYSLEGQLLNVAAGPNEFTDHPRHKSVVPDIAVYRNNRILVLDPIRKAVRVFKRKRF
jgi:DNA-binding beta-propeller fold protein YncE